MGDDPVRRLADWIEDLRYLLTVPAQSVFGQVGCLAGRTIAYRRTAFEPAVAALTRQTVFGIPQHVGDDRVLTNALLRAGWRTDYQSTARVETGAPPDYADRIAWLGDLRALLRRTPWIEAVAWSQLPRRGKAHQRGTGIVDWDVQSDPASAGIIATA